MKHMKYRPNTKCHDSNNVERNYKSSNHRHEPYSYYDFPEKKFRKDQSKKDCRTIFLKVDFSNFYIENHKIDYISKSNIILASFALLILIIFLRKHLAWFDTSRISFQNFLTVFSKIFFRNVIIEIVLLLQTKNLPIVNILHGVWNGLDLFPCISASKSDRKFISNHTLSQPWQYNKFCLTFEKAKNFKPRGQLHTCFVTSYVLRRNTFLNTIYALFTMF